MQTEKCRAVSAVSEVSGRSAPWLHSRFTDRRLGLRMAGLSLTLSAGLGFSV